LTDDSPLADAVIEKAPDTVPAVTIVDVATPSAAVTAVTTPPANDADGPKEGVTNVTVTPCTGFPKMSVALTRSGWPNAVATVVVWPPPPVAESKVAADAVLVRLKEAVLLPGADANTVTPPALEFAVIAADVATPSTPVTAVVVPPAKRIDAPLVGTVKVTVTPETGLP
jgi:hypothetical protein